MSRHLFATEYCSIFLDDKHFNLTTLRYTTTNAGSNRQLHCVHKKTKHNFI